MPDTMPADEVAAMRSPKTVASSEPSPVSVTSTSTELQAALAKGCAEIAAILARQANAEATEQATDSSENDSEMLSSNKVADKDETENSVSTNVFGA